MGDILCDYEQVFLCIYATLLNTSSHLNESAHASLDSQSGICNPALNASLRFFAFAVSLVFHSERPCFGTPRIEKEALDCPSFL
jgi:hypothetical protein